MKKNKNEQIVADKCSAQILREAIKDDQGLSDVAKNIHVTVKEGTITLDGKVATDQQLNLATNTASAVAGEDKVKNRMDVTNNK